MCSKQQPLAGKQAPGVRHHHQLAVSGAATLSCTKLIQVRGEHLRARKFVSRLCSCCKSEEQEVSSWGNALSLLLQSTNAL